MGTWDDPLFWPDIQLLIRRSGAAAPLLDRVRALLGYLHRSHRRHPVSLPHTVGG